MDIFLYTTSLTDSTSYIDIINCIATCATAIFTLGAVIGAVIFAYKQNKIAARGQEVDLELRYFNHYQKLSNLLYLFGAYFDPATIEINGKTMPAFAFSSEQHDKYYVTQFNVDNLKLLQLLKNEAELCFSKDITNLNQHIFEKAYTIFIKQVFVTNYNDKTTTQYSYDINSGVLENTFATHKDNPIPLELELKLAYEDFKDLYLSHDGMLKIKKEYYNYTRKISDIKNN